MFFVQFKRPAAPKSRIRRLLSWLKAANQWHAPVRRSELPPWLREDLGLDPEPEPVHWLEQGHHPIYPHVFHRWKQ